MTARVILASLVLALAGCQQKIVAEFSAPEANFKIKFIDEPRVTTETDDGVTIKKYLVETVSRCYMVRYIETTVSRSESPSAISARLEEARDDAVRAIKGKYNPKTKSIRLADRFPGIEFTGSAEGRKVRGRVYLVGPKTYQVYAMTRTEEDLTCPEAEEFFETFALLEMPNLPPAPNIEEKPSDDGPPVPSFSEPPPKPETWVNVQSKDGGFEAYFPTEAVEGACNVGPVQYRVFRSETDEMAVELRYADLSIPEGEPVGMSRERLAEARNCVLSESGAKLTWTDWHPLASAYPGEEYGAVMTGKQLRGRVYLVGHRVYCLSVVGSRETISKRADLLLDSFRLAK